MTVITGVFMQVIILELRATNGFLFPSWLPKANGRAPRHLATDNNIILIYIRHLHTNLIDNREKGRI
jgi:hypothetical protein